MNLIQQGKLYHELIFAMVGVSCHYGPNLIPVQNMHVSPAKSLLSHNALVENDSSGGVLHNRNEQFWLSTDSLDHFRCVLFSLARS